MNIPRRAALNWQMAEKT